MKMRRLNIFEKTMKFSLPDYCFAPLINYPHLSTFAAMQQLPTAVELKKGGVLLIDKPYKWTSFDAVNSIKIALRAKIGHAGTLDPLATGLLICCTGEMTKKISGYQQLRKEYTGIFHLGATTATYDLESRPENIMPYEQVT